PFGMPDYARLDDLGPQVHQGPDHAMWVDGGADYAAGVDPRQAQSREFAGADLEVPPRNAVLRAHYCSVFAQDGAKLRGQLSQTVRLHAEDDNVHRAGVGQIADNAGADLELAVRGEDLEAGRLHRPQMGTPRVQRHVEAGPGHTRAD